MVQGLAYAGIAAIMALLFYANFKIDAKASANEEGLRNADFILRDNKYIKASKVLLCLFPLSGFFVGVNDSGIYMYLSLGLFFLLLIGAGLTFFIGSRAIDHYRSPSD